MREQDLVEIMDAIYAGPLDDASWQRVMEIIRKLFPYTYSGLAFYDAELDNLSLNTLGDFDHDDIKKYEAHYASVNPWVKINMATPVETALRSSDFLPTKDFRKTEFYNDWLSQYDKVDEGIGSVVMREPDRMALLGVHYRSDQIDDQEARRLTDFVQFISPHLRRAFQLRRKMEGLRSHIDGLEHSLERVGSAVLVLDRACNVTFANFKAQELISANGNLYLNLKERLCFTSPTANERLRKMVFTMTQTSEFARSFEKQDNCLKISGSDKELVGMIFPISPDMTGRSVAEQCFVRTERFVLLFLIDPMAGINAPVPLVQMVLGITAAEARLALALQQGCSTNEYADQNSLSRNTVRNQIQSILQKTGAAKQSDLVRMITTIFGTQNLATDL